MCCRSCPPPPPASRTHSNLSFSAYSVDCCVLFPPPAAATVATIYCVFVYFSPSFSADCCFIPSFSTPHIPTHIPIDCCVVCLRFCVLSWPLAFRPEVNRPTVSSSVYLSAAPAVIATAMASESTPPTPPSVAVAGSLLSSLPLSFVSFVRFVRSIRLFSSIELIDEKVRTMLATINQGR